LEVNHEYFLEDIPNVENQFKRLVILNVNDTPRVLKLIRQARLKAKGI